jgi:uncharacterized surface protein with fasciclin (FAS1) repeats
MDIIIQTLNKHLTTTTPSGYLYTDSIQNLYKNDVPAVSTSTRKERSSVPHSIVETAREAGTFQTLLTAVAAAGLGLNDATVIQADVEAENGVIHVIDRVLIPAA